MGFTRVLYGFIGAMSIGPRFMIPVKCSMGFFLTVLQVFLSGLVLSGFLKFGVQSYLGLQTFNPKQVDFACSMSPTV